MATVCFSRPAGKLLIKEGQRVDFKTPLLKSSENELVTQSVVSHLGIQPSEIFLVSRKVVGDEIKEGEVVAEKKTFFRVKKFLSPLNGVIKEINHEDGTITIETSKKGGSTVPCFFQGEVEKVTDNEICLKVTKSAEFQLTSTDDTFGGGVLFVTESDAHTLTEDAVAGHVIFIDLINPYELSKVEALGASGFVSPQSLKSDNMPPKAVLKNKNDFEKIRDSKAKYCIIDKKNSTLYLYA